MSGLQTDNLTVGYGSPLVKEISLCVRPGRVLTLIGPNGCGKSTILKSVTRQLKIMGGSILLGGQAMETMKEAEIAKKLAMVMTEHIRPELMTCRDIVATGRYPYTGRLGILTETDWQKVEEAIAFVHAEDVAVQDFNKVSDGQRQRIMLARAICQETEILVLDEPTSYLDIRYKLDILSGIRRLAREKNVAVIMSLHELDLAGRISDKIACVHGDRVDRFGTPEEIFTDGYIAVNIAATDLTVKSAVLGLAVSAISAGMGILKSRRFFCLCRQFRFGKWNPDFSHIGKVDFNCNMLLSADSLRTVNYDFFNQFIYRSCVQLLQIGIPVGKLEEPPHIGNLSGFIFNFPFQRSSKPLNFFLLRFILC